MIQPFLPRGNTQKTDIMRVAPLLTTVKGRNDPRAHRQMDGLENAVVQTTKCYSTLEKKEIPTRAAAQTDVKDLMISEISRHKRTTAVSFTSVRSPA